MGRREYETNRPTPLDVPTLTSAPHQRLDQGLAYNFVFSLGEEMSKKKRIKKLESALKVIYVWTLSGAATKEHILELIDKVIKK